MSPVKFFLAAGLLLFPLVNGSSEDPGQTNNVSGQIITEILEHVNKTGWDNRNANKLSFLLRNSEIISGADLNNLIHSADGYHKTYLLSLLQKKKGAYREMYDSLLVYLNSQPEYYPYFDELVFSANASEMLSSLENSVKGKESTSYFAYMQGLIRFYKGNFGSATGYFQQALEKDSANSSVLLQLASVDRNLGMYNTASAYLDKVLSKQMTDPETKSSANLSLGALYFLSGEYQNSDKYYRQALKSAITSNDKYHEAKAYVNLGINEDIKGNIEKGREYFNKALEISEKIKDHELLALCLSELGVSYSYTFDLSTARKFYLRSYGIYKKTNNKTRLALLSGNIGKIYTQLNDFSGAVKYFEDGIIYAAENKRALYLNKSGLADVFNNLGDYAKALKLYNECEKLSSEIEDNYLKGETNQSLGVLNYNLGRYSTALNYYNKADYYFSDDLWLSAEILHKKGLLYLNTDSLNLAEECFTGAVKKSEEYKDDYQLAISLIDFADLKLKQKRYTEATKMLKTAEAISVKNSFDNLQAELYLTEARIIDESSGKFQDARDKLIKSADISRSTKNTGLLTEVLYRLALLYDKYDFPELAESYYNLSLSEAENKGRFLYEDQEAQISFYNLSTDIYNSFADFYLKRNQNIKAFEIIDRGHSRNNIQNLGNIKLRSLVKQDSLVDKLYEYSWMIQSGVYDPLTADSVSALFNGLKEKIIESEPRTKPYINGGRYYSVTEVQENLAANEYIISIHISGSSTFVFKLSREGFEVFREDISNQEIRKLISSISPFYKEDRKYPYYNQDLFAFNSAASAELYARLLKSSLSKIPVNSSIIFIPGTELLLLPFEFLVTDFNTSQSAFSYANKSFLINKYNISYAPSVSVFINQRQNNPDNTDKYLLVGNPFVSSRGNILSERRSLLGLDTLAMLPLKYSADEVSEIGSILKTSTIFTEKDATETNFKENANNSRIIHISTHSFLINKQPVIFFSSQDDQKNDGFLETSEIVQMNLNSDLVVLSSCNSGVGRIEEAEGVIGMAKALFEAGTKSVVVSLWEVNDKYTSAFMTLFYSHLSKGLSKTEALRNAKMDFMREYSSNPYYWSAFILTGSTEKIHIAGVTGLSSYLIPFLLIIAGLSLFLYYLRKKNNKEARNPL